MKERPGRIDNLNDHLFQVLYDVNRGKLVPDHKRVCCVEGWGALGRRNWFSPDVEVLCIHFPVSEMEFVGR